MLKLNNTLTRRKEPFEPLDPDHVGMYVCGPTVYDFSHIGNARPVVVFDILYRLLRRLYPKVTYVRNITDVDDKINARAKEAGEDIHTLTTRTTEQYHADMMALGALSPDHEPRATDHISEMVALISRLLERGCAYEADSHVLFHVPDKDDYGRLSGHSRDEQIAGARVEVAPYKRDPADFVLWKPSNDGEPGWDSPWGHGRPGWHIECSAMSSKYLGLDFDIHGGGQDLVFPHHENELAQSTCAYPDHGFARYWLHNGHLTTDSEKMSKSLGNMVNVRELLREYPGEVIRLALLSTHYRQPLDFTTSGLDQAKRTLDRIYGALRSVPDASMGEGKGGNQADDVLEALEDDLNTPLAIARLHELAGTLNKVSAGDEQVRLASALLDAGSVLGLLQQHPEDWFKHPASDESVSSIADIERLIADRAAARDAREFGEADRIRKLLEAQGVLLEDTSEGTIWRRG